MGHLFKLSLCLATAVGFLHAQNVSSPTPLPPAMRGAIDRLVKRNAVDKNGIGFQRPQATLFAAPTNPEFLDKSLAETCSVPLIEMHIDNPERFTMLTVPTPATQDRMPLAQMPAPPCDRAASSFPAQQQVR